MLAREMLQDCRVQKAVLIVSVVLAVLQTSLCRKWVEVKQSVWDKEATARRVQAPSFTVHHVVRVSGECRRTRGGDARLRPALNPPF